MRQVATQPMLLDEAGESRELTGEVSVRFMVSPSEEELRRFARRHGLRLLYRNEFVPQQAVFRPVEDSHLPALAHRLEQEAGVRAAWPNTLSQYRRAPGF